MIRKANCSDIPALTQLAMELWPGNTYDAVNADIKATMEKGNTAFFLIFALDLPVGFAQCSLRYDYVEGTQSSPVGYLEGVYVSPKHRRRGLARSLVTACEVWARGEGCDEFASDCELTNGQSLAFHMRMGFAETNRIICFAKKL